MWGKENPQNTKASSVSAGTGRVEHSSQGWKKSVRSDN
jgi:hypothetical protein